ncbi:unnamed protein product [Closterium sp. NIES-64]|nr:unnamed protein product [Closterium sp. NIES-64]
MLRETLAALRTVNIQLVTRIKGLELVEARLSEHEQLQRRVREFEKLEEIRFKEYEKLEIRVRDYEKLEIRVKEYEKLEKKVREYEKLEESRVKEYEKLDIRVRDYEKLEKRVREYEKLEESRVKEYEKLDIRVLRGCVAELNQVPAVGVPQLVSAIKAHIQPEVEQEGEDLVVVDSYPNIKENMKLVVETIRMLLAAAPRMASLHLPD